MHTILHVSGDFPDPFAPAKTRAIQSLVDLTADRFDHHVISINRGSVGVFGTLREILLPTPMVLSEAPFGYGSAIRYTAPGKGLRHRTKLVQLGEWLAGKIATMPRRPDLIVGHKLTIEGIAVRRAAQMTGIPYGLSIQGNTDTKVLNAHPGLADELRAVLHGAKVIFPFAPWAWQRITAKLGAPPAVPIMLPCATDLDQPLQPRIGDGGLICVFHLSGYRHKNLAGMVRAVKALEKRGRAPTLTILGGGDADVHARCAAMIARTPTITLAGAKDREQVREAMNRSVALVLPSLRETFGMVFVEALFAGLPIIYPRGAGVDGYFDGAPFALPVNARDHRSIAAAMDHAIAREREIKEALERWQGSDAIRIFQRDRIAERFAAGLVAAINSP
ncbi:MAG: glycosyltransferase [Erythrobacter sp.]|jgi:glycosyltransferase involved in cell wall biosynthesis|nr:glycosyltransferase [Erythrobacter sp.]